MQDTAVVRTTRLSKSYGSVRALSELDLSIEPGEVFGYLGPNGAGKTTTLRLLMGSIRPSSGSATVFGLDAWRDSVAVHRKVGYLPSDAALYGRLTGSQHIRYFLHLRGTPDAAHARELAGRLDLDLTRPARALSKGNRQKLALVLALMSRPALLILDEPTTGLDPLVQQTFAALVSEHTANGGSVLLSSHVLGEVQRIANRIGVVRAGRLIAVEQLEVLRGRALHHITARFADLVQAAEFDRLPELRDVRLADGVLRCSAPRSALDVLLKQVAGHDVLDFECAEAELEETFLAYYGVDGHAG
jgi:ABC-2 type transport system ATP-binding protein